MTKNMTEEEDMLEADDCLGSASATVNFISCITSTVYFSAIIFQDSTTALSTL